MNKRLAFILGIRPDVIRAALILKHLRAYPELEVSFIWSGQHYSDNLKDLFFRELDIKPAELDLGCRGNTDAEVVGSLVGKLYETLDKLRPAAAIFLGDTNTTAGALAAAQLNIPIVHIEGGMRSYDWRMPEEKYRTVIDHLSDVIYVYCDEYRDQAIREGINPRNVVVVGNPIVDILQHYYFARKDHFDRLAQHAARTHEEGVAVARLAQRLRGHCAHLSRCESVQPLREARQAGEATRHRFFGEESLLVETAAEAHRFLQVVDAAVLALVELPDLEAKAVGAHVDRRKLARPAWRRAVVGGRRHGRFGSHGTGLSRQT